MTIRKPITSITFRSSEKRLNNQHLRKTSNNPEHTNSSESPLIDPDALNARAHRILVRPGIIGRAVPPVETRDWGGDTLRNETNIVFFRGGKFLTSRNVPDRYLKSIPTPKGRRKRAVGNSFWARN